MTIRRVREQGGYLPPLRLHRHSVSTVKLAGSGKPTRYKAMVMGFRFRKTLRVVPGIRVNVSKSGVSTTIGRPGATANLGRRGLRWTVGLPGSGLSYSRLHSIQFKGRVLSRSAPHIIWIAFIAFWATISLIIWILS